MNVLRRACTPGIAVCWSARPSEKRLKSLRKRPRFYRTPCVCLVQERRATCSVACDTGLTIDDVCRRPKAAIKAFLKRTLHHAREGSRAHCVPGHRDAVVGLLRKPGRRDDRG